MDAKLRLSVVILNPLFALKISRFAYSPTCLPLRGHIEPAFRMSG